MQLYTHIEIKKMFGLGEQGRLSHVEGVDALATSNFAYFTGLGRS